MSASDNAFVVNELTERKVGLTTTNQQLGENVGIASTEISAFSSPCSEIDSEILDRINLINQLKSEIITISNNAFNVSSGNNVLGFPIRTCSVSASNSTVETRNFILAGTASVSLVNRGLTQTTISPITGDPVVGILTSLVSSAPVYPDRLRAWVYPQLENTSVLNDDAYQGESHQTVTSANTGVGATSVVFVNGTYNGEFSATSLGTYYEITGSGGSVCSSALSQINAKEQQITTIRAGLSTLTNGVNSIKSQKTKLQFGNWGARISIRENNRELDGINAALNVMANIDTFT
jgi:hypothetical protein